MRIFLVSYFAPSPVGHGGLHRTLQVQHDARALVGQPNVASINVESWQQARQPAQPGSRQRAALLVQKCRGVRRRLRKWGTRLALVRENPFNLFSVDRYPTAIPFSTRLSVEPEFVAHYAELVTKDARPSVCIVEHAVFGEIVALNSRLGIPTISAFQNLEALDATSFDWRRRQTVYKIMADLGNEIRLMAQCAERLTISKVEAGFVGGLGLECHYYPYVPVGLLRQSLDATRRHRANHSAEPGLIVLLGSAQHGVTGESMRWFAGAALECGLPDGVRVVAVGGDTDKLLPPGKAVRGLELRGWLEQAELDALLERAAAAVIPQRLGFGALTRLPELACAGVPVITFSHPSYALNPPPGLRTVEQNWNDVCAAMKDCLRSTAAPDPDEYERWEAQQPRPMASAVRRLAPADELHGGPT
ncbi:MAG: hypothetical protein M3069_16045 [Chloroflexota bacterium]|nr:hypothetical protein [Chloroflexota bacterium]